jgi:membrane protein DedA with SNARE-associated domain
MHLLDASVTNSLVTLATHAVKDLGLAGVAAMITCSAIIFIPGTEATMLFAGFNVYQHSLSLAGIIVAGVIGDVVGATIAYWIGRSGLHELLARRGSPIHISERRLALAHGWFERYGPPVMTISRLIPVLRSAFPYAAGTVETPFWRFIGFTLIGSIVWIGGLGVLGDQVGSDWSSWRAHLDYVDYAVALLIVAAVVYLVVRRVRGDRARRATV